MSQTSAPLAASSRLRSLTLSPPPRSLAGLSALPRLQRLVLDPWPGDLSAAERSKLGLPDQGLAFRVGYIVDWGGVPDPRYGQRARKAGLRKGDLVLGVEGASLRHHAHFHSWWRLTRQPGDEVVLRVRRGDQERRVRLEVPPRR